MPRQSPKATLPDLPRGFAYRLDLSRAATPRLLRQRPVHRWFGFPHSYSPQLVEAILDEWILPVGSMILDPFAGAGTTLRVAQDRGYSALGTDLSPIAVLVSSAKVKAYDRRSVEAALADLQKQWTRRKELEPRSAKQGQTPVWVKSERLQKAFIESELAALAALRADILGLEEGVRGFFFVALLSILPDFSRAIADGGWLRWIERPDRSEDIAPAFWRKVQEMTEDLPLAENCLREGKWETRILDARRLHTLQTRIFQGLITSPPYLNRHDYSRVFQLELLTIGMSEEDVFTLRYGSLRSHVEAKPATEDSSDKPPQYNPPSLLTECLGRLPEDADPRVRRMIQGYFEDMFLVLWSAGKVLRHDAKAAFVVGNVRHSGVLFPVDEILIAIGEQAGYIPLESWVIRLRGNSAQQMGRYGRVPSRETVVMLRAPNSAAAS